MGVTWRHSYVKTDKKKKRLEHQQIEDLDHIYIYTYIERYICAYTRWGDFWYQMCPWEGNDARGGLAVNEQSREGYANLERWFQEEAVGDPKRLGCKSRQPWRHRLLSHEPRCYCFPAESRVGLLPWSF